MRRLIEESRKFLEVTVHRIRPSNRPVLCRIYGRICGGNFKIFGGATASNPVRNPVGYPARNRSDCDMAVTVHFQFRFRSSLFVVIEVFEHCNIIQNVVACVYSSS